MVKKNNSLVVLSSLLNTTTLTKLILLLIFIFNINSVKSQNKDTTNNNNFSESYSFNITPNLCFSKINNISGNVHLSSETGKGLLTGFLYNLHYKNTFLSAGFNAGFLTVNHSLDLKKENFDIPWDFYDYEHEYFGYAAIPIDIGIRKKITESFDIIALTGISFSSLIHNGNGLTMGMGDTTNYTNIYDIEFNANNTNVLNTELNIFYYPKIGFKFGFGIIKKFNNYNRIIVNLLYHSLFSNQSICTYTLLPDDNNNISKGEILSKNNFIGLNIAYDFSSKK